MRFFIEYLAAICLGIMSIGAALHCYDVLRYGKIMAPISFRLTVGAAALIPVLFVVWRAIR